MKIASKDLDNLQDAFGIAQIHYNREVSFGKAEMIVSSE